MTPAEMEGGSALLVDLDQARPNLALMHISTWRKALGFETGFRITDPDEVWASVVFSWNRHKADGLRYWYPNARIDIGGGGFRPPQETAGGGGPHDA